MTLLKISTLLIVARDDFDGSIHKNNIRKLMDQKVKQI